MGPAPAPACPLTDATSKWQKDNWKKAVAARDVAHRTAAAAGQPVTAASNAARGLETWDAAVNRELALKEFAAREAAILARETAQAERDYQAAQMAARVESMRLAPHPAEPVGKGGDGGISTLRWGDHGPPGGMGGAGGTRPNPYAAGPGAGAYPAEVQVPMTRGRTLAQERGPDPPRRGQQQRPDRGRGGRSRSPLPATGESVFHSGRGKGLPPCPQWGTEADDDRVTSVATGTDLGCGFFFSFQLWEEEPYYNGVGFALQCPGPGHKCRLCHFMWPLYSPQFHRCTCPLGLEIKARSGGIPRD